MQVNRHALIKIPARRHIQIRYTRSTTEKQREQLEQRIIQLKLFIKYCAFNVNIN